LKPRHGLAGAECASAPVFHRCGRVLAACRFRRALNDPRARCRSRLLHCRRSRLHNLYLQHLQKLQKNFVNQPIRRGQRSESMGTSTSHGRRLLSFFLSVGFFPFVFMSSPLLLKIGNPKGSHHTPRARARARPPRSSACDNWACACCPAPCATRRSIRRRRLG
jgi:hypothetical protein